MGVMLRHTGRCMPQHFRYVFEFDVIGQGDGCGKCVSEHVEYTRQSKQQRTGID